MKDSKTLDVRPALEIHIDELVLHGFSPRDRFAIGDAVQDELARLITEQGLPGFTAQPLSADRLDGGAFTVAPGAQPATVGAHVATKVHQGLASAQKRVAANPRSKGALNR